MADKVVITKSKLDSLANHINAKAGVSGAKTLTELETVVDSIGSDIDALVEKTIVNVKSENVVTVGYYAFAYCPTLETVDYPSATSIKQRAFTYCTALETVNCPSVKTIDTESFFCCTNLTTVDFSSLEEIDNRGFMDCSNLTIVSLPSIKNISHYAFASCDNLTALILQNDKVCDLDGASAFANTPIESGTGYIYVPSSLVESYKADEIWSTYAAQIRAIEDYPEITGG